jgi:multidrug efflux system outer membrane protein
MKRRVLALLVASALAGCSLEPHYVRPAEPVPPSWPAGDAYLRQSEAALPSVSYRDIFRDPKLQAIIAQGLANNRDLRIAAANIASARAQFHVQRAELFPTVDAAAGVTVGDRGSNSGSSNNVTSTFSLGVGVTGWEIDLFGRLRSLSHAALDRWFASEAAARETRLELVADIADAYLAYASDQSLLAISRETETSAARSVDLTGARLRGGIAPRTDLRQAETILDQARSDVARLTTSVAQDKNALDLLVGAPVDPALLPASIETIDAMLAELPAGLSSEVLLRRPDVVQAEYQLRGANAQIGAARAAFFPRISLTALAGLASSALGSLFSGGSFSWSVQPNATVPIFDAGANRGNLANARAQRDAALASYEKAIQTAFRDVADALARRGTIGAQLAADTQRVEAARDSFTLAEARYREGIDSFLQDLDAQRSLYAAQQTLTQTRLVRAQNLVALYRSLGGDQLLDAPPAGPPVPAVR